MEKIQQRGKKTYKVIYPGYKYNLTDINAAIALHQLDRIEEINNKRKKYAEIYLKEFKDFDLIKLPPNSNKEKECGFGSYNRYNPCFIDLKLKQCCRGKEYMLKGVYGDLTCWWILSGQNKSLLIS